VKNFALPLLIVFVYVLFIVPQARRRKQAAALRREVEPGAEVMLTSGLFGTVVEIDGDTVVIEAAEGVRLRYAKGAVQRVLPEAYDDDADESGETDEHDHADGVDAADHDSHGGPEVAVAGADDESTDDTIDEDVPRRDVVARPANRFKRSTRSRSSGNDAGPGPVPTS
jgi:preprotein translocase subunit YajC